MDKTKENKGITIIALIVTIIVLLILAGISISMLTEDNGIINQAKSAKQASEEAGKTEKEEINNIQEEAGIKPTNSIKPGEFVTKTEKQNYTDKNGDKATIPAGFTVSKIAEEQKIANGLVIYEIPEKELSNVNWTAKNEDGSYQVQEKYNQFVWVPVKNEESYVRDLSYPCYYETGNPNDKVPEGSTFTDTRYLPNILQPNSDTSQTNEIAERIAVVKWNGFYIGRYEAGIENEKVISKKSAQVYAYKTQEELKEIAKTMYGDNNKNVKSAMCTGIQWDILMKFIDGKNDGMGNKYNIRESNTKRHKENSVEQTGNNLNDKVQNLYDLEGNCYEYVAEKNNSTNPYIARGRNILHYILCDSLRKTRRKRERI